MSPPAVVVPRLDRTFAQEIAGERQVERWLPTSINGEDLHPSEILRKHSERCWRVGELYDRMIGSDLDLAGYIDKRFDAVLALPRWIVPVDSSPRAVEVAEFCQAALSLVSNLASNLQHQLLSHPKGIAIEELVWEKIPRGPLAGSWLPTQMIGRPMWRFKFKSGELYVRRPLGEAETPAPPGKFLVMRRGAKDSPWGEPKLDDVYWYWWLKKNGLKFFAGFLDKWAQPTAVGTYRHQKGADAVQANEEAQKQLLAAIEAMQSEYGIALPEGLKIELLEATRSGSASYESFVGLLNRSMALAFLGEVDTSGASKGPGSFAKSQVSNEVRMEKVTRDAHDLSSHLTDHLLAPIVAVNWGADEPVPRFQIDTIEAEDRQLRQAGIAAVLDAGEAVPRRYFYQTYQVPVPRDGEEVVLKREPAPPPPAPAAPTPVPEPPHDPPADPPTPDPPTDGEPPQARASAPAAVALAAVEPEAEADLAEIESLAGERADDLDALAAQLVEPTLTYYAGWRDILLAAWDDGAIAAGQGLRRLVGTIDPVAHARHLETAQLHGAGLALQQTTEDLGGTAPLLFSLPPGWESAKTPTSAIDYWSRVTTVPKEAFNLLSDGNRRMAFTVAGVEDAALLVEIHRLLGQAMAEGWVRDRFVRELEGLFTSRGLDPLARWHAELVYTNNVRQAAAAMRYSQLVGNPAAKRLTPYLVWVSMDDGKVRPEHQAMHRFIAPVDSPIWKTWWPPAGHGCRCMVEPINLAKARRMGLTGSEPVGPWPQFEGADVQPDAGFGGSPSLGAVAHRLEPRARQIEEDAKAGGEDLAEAMRQLLTQLLLPNAA